jgi:hypothetical protein
MVSEGPCWRRVFTSASIDPSDPARQGRACHLVKGAAQRSSRVCDLTGPTDARTCREERWPLHRRRQLSVKSGVPCAPSVR